VGGVFKGVVLEGGGICVSARRSKVILGYVTSWHLKIIFM